ncbi:MAG: LCP family protein [Nitriliruptorales bacterium]
MTETRPPRGLGQAKTASPPETSTDVWGPTVVGHGRRQLRRTLLLAAAGLVIAAGVVVALLYQVANSNLERVALPALAERSRGPLNVLVVGSDARSGLTPEEARLYTLGETDGERGDTVMLISLGADRRHAGVVSFPRDLLVRDGDRRRKLTEAFADGPDRVVRLLQTATGVPIHHYVEVSIPGFIGVVEAVDGVEICLDEALHDPKSGANFTAGCHHFDPRASLAYVRSRATERGDFDRMERQQTLMRALLQRLTAMRTLVDVPRLFDVVERVSRNVSTDSELGPRHMARLALQLRRLAAGSVPMITMPAYPTELDGRSYVVPYEPGARRLFKALAEGSPIMDHGTREQRQAASVALWTTSRSRGLDRVQRTLFWSGFTVNSAGRGPLDGGRRTTVYAVPGHEQAAGWVEATLGAPGSPLPANVSVPSGVHVIVALGEDAA